MASIKTFEDLFRYLRGHGFDPLDLPEQITAKLARGDLQADLHIRPSARKRVARRPATAEEINQVENKIAAWFEALPPLPDDLHARKQIEKERMQTTARIQEEGYAHLREVAPPAGITIHIVRRSWGPVPLFALVAPDDEHLDVEPLRALDWDWTDCSITIANPEAVDRLWAITVPDSPDAAVSTAAPTPAPTPTPTTLATWLDRLPAHGSTPLKVALAIWWVRDNQRELMRLRSNAQSNAIHDLIATGFSAGRSSWTKARRLVKQLDDENAGELADFLRQYF